jgi:MFS family permease
MFFTKLTEYSAYGAASAIFVLYLSNDVLAGGQPLGDTNAYLFYTVWGLALTVVTIMVGSVCDTIGVKKCLLIGAVMLLTSRFFMPLSQNVVVVALVGFLPLAIGFAITGPVLKVGIKMFTTLKTATLGFGLFYTMMNVGFYFGATIADWFRETYGDTGTVPVLGMELTTYQAIIGVGFLINIPDFIAILIMRDGAEMTEKGLVLKEESDGDETAVIAALRSDVASRRRKMMGELFKSAAAVLAVAGLSYVMIQTEVHKWAINVVPVGKYLWALVVVLVLFSVGGVLYALFSQAGTLNAGGGFDRAMKAVRDATQGTIAQLKENFQQKPFWIYMGMLGILVFVRLTFYIFHVMFPTYATRVLGPDFPVASIFGALNPAMIVFLVPLISILSINIRSYTMLLIGTAVSAGSVFLCFMPESMALGLGNTWLGTWIFDYWLEAPVGSQDPFVVSLVVFIIVFTIGEAIWSPRLMQFSAEIAPRGKEGAYIALAMLPYFVGKMGAAVLSEQLTTRFFNDSMVAFPKHQLAWLAIGSMALISPIGLVIFRKVFSQSERMAELEATAAAAAAEVD